MSLEIMTALVLVIIQIKETKKVVEENFKKLGWE